MFSEVLQHGMQNGKPGKEKIISSMIVYDFFLEPLSRLKCKKV